MPNSPTTLSSSACDTTGTPIPLSYGYVWATGKRANYYMLENTGNNNMDYTRTGMWLLGHGEWDGCTELWINDKPAADRSPVEPGGKIVVEDISLTLERIGGP